MTVTNPGISRSAILPPVLAAPHVPLLSDSRVITTFQTGHGWAYHIAGGSGTDDTSVYTLGSQSLKLSSPPNNTTTVNEQSPLLAAPIDLTKNALHLLLRAENVAQGASINVTVSSDNYATNSARAPLWPTATGSPPVANPWWTEGQWQHVTVSKAGYNAPSGTVDWTAINALRIEVQGAGGGTFSVYCQKVAVVPFAVKPVITFMFDDGWLGCWNIARPILDAYGFAATLYHISESAILTAFAGIDHMTIDQLQAAQDNCGWDICSHAYSKTIHDDSAGGRYTGVTDTAAAYDFQRMKTWLGSNGLRGGDHIAWPGGQFDAAKLAVARRFFRTARPYAGLGQMETYPPCSPWHMRQYQVDPAKTIANVTDKIDTHIASNAWLMLSYHDFYPDSGSPGGTNPGLQVKQSNFQGVVDYVATLVAAGTVECRTLTEVLAPRPTQWSVDSAGYVTGLVVP